MREYQHALKKEGLSDSYIDQHIGAARTMLNRAWENEEINGDALRPFKVVKKLLKNSKANARDRILSPEEYDHLMEHLPIHIKPIITMGYYTGMRRKEVLTLTWDKVNLKERFIELEVLDTKDKESMCCQIRNKKRV